ncbi:hypothetical protein D5S17_31705 [Pseudonocardiaceae bacterium YIM PH 21723]|nr:hypothetical protein D5S17_31705 [Pseudonocardiaceae bacterium YIM PH 21723]
MARALALLTAGLMLAGGFALAWDTDAHAAGVQGIRPADRTITKVGPGAPQPEPGETCKGRSLPNSAKWEWVCFPTEQGGPTTNRPAPPPPQPPRRTEPPRAEPAPAPAPVPEQSSTTEPPASSALPADPTEQPSTEPSSENQPPVRQAEATGLSMRDGLQIGTVALWVVLGGVIILTRRLYPLRKNRQVATEVIPAAGSTPAEPAAAPQHSP